MENVGVNRLGVALPLHEVKRRHAGHHDRIRFHAVLAVRLQDLLDDCHPLRGHHQQDPQYLVIIVLQWEGLLHLEFDTEMLSQSILCPTRRLEVCFLEADHVHGDPLVQSDLPDRVRPNAALLIDNQVNPGIPPSRCDPPVAKHAVAGVLEGLEHADEVVHVDSDGDACLVAVFATEPVDLGVDGERDRHVLVDVLIDLLLKAHGGGQLGHHPRQITIRANDHPDLVLNADAECLHVDIVNRLHPPLTRTLELIGVDLDGVHIDLGPPPNPWIDCRERVLPLEVRLGLAAHPRRVLKAQVVVANHHPYPGRAFLCRRPIGSLGLFLGRVGHDILLVLVELVVRRYPQSWWRCWLILVRRDFHSCSSVVMQ